MARVLVTGGAGYIGSHTCKALATAGHVPITYDSLENGRRSTVKWGPLEEGDILDGHRLRCVIEKYRPESVVHFAAYIQVAESITFPEKYYINNVVGTLSLLEAMRDSGVGSIVFSSTAAVYGIPASLPVTETCPLAPVNPYGHTKSVAETILANYGHAYGLRWVALRYFNAAGADPDGHTGALHDPATNLIPLAVTAGLGTGPQLNVFGTDYDTPDGTAIRDFIHVTDLAMAHFAALEYLDNAGAPGPFNLGSGRGYSVREVIDTVSRQLGRTVPAVNRPRRPGDMGIMIANSAKAESLLKWAPRHSSLEEIIESAIAWERRQSSAGSPPDGGIKRSSALRRSYFRPRAGMSG